MQIYLKNKYLIRGFILSLVILSILGIYTIHLLNKTKKDDYWVIHTYDVISKLDKILNNTIESIVSVQDYILLKDKSYVESFNYHQNLINNEIKNLRALTSDNVTQQNNLDTLQLLNQNESLFFKNLINNKEYPAAIKTLRTSIIQKNIKKIHFLIDRMQLIETGMLNRRLQDLNTTDKKLSIIFSIALSFSFIVLILIFYELNKQINKRKKAEEKLKKINKDLNLLVKQRTEEIENAYKSISKNEERFQLAAQATQDVLWEIDYKEKTEWLSSDYHYILKCEPREIISSYDFWFNSIHPKDRNKVKELMETRTKSDVSVFTIEYRVLRKDGTTAYIKNRANIIRDNNGEVVRMVGAMSDITETIKTHNELLKSEKKYKDIVTQFPLGIYQSDEQGKLLTANLSLAKILKYENIDEILKCNLQKDIYYNEDERQKSINLHTETGSEFVSDLEVLWKKKDGTPIWISLTARSIKDENDVLIYYEGFVQDISERKKAEENLYNSEERLNYVIKATNDAVYDWNIVTGNLWWNENLSLLFNYKPEEIMSNIDWWAERIHPDDEKRVNGALNEALENKDNYWENEYRFNCGNDRCAYIKDRGYILYNENNKPVRMIGSMMDITKDKEAELSLIEAKEKAEEMNMLKSNFLANMSHELRTPMIGILGYTEILEKEIKQKDLKAMLNHVNQSGQRLLNTLNSILNFSKIESAKIEKIITEVNLFKIVNEVVQLFQHSAANNNIHLKLLAEDESLCSKLDEDLFYEIMTNLVSNAVKYTKKGEITVAISLSQDKNFTEIKVKDTGIGIPKELQPIIFEPFRQVSEGLSRKFEGTGLGLTIVMKYVQLMNGILLLDSKINEGSTFTVRFPLAKSKAKIDLKATTAKDKIDRVSNEKFFNALFVDDDYMSREIVTRFLKNTVNVETVNDAETFLKLSKDKKYDALFIDINLGDTLNGFQLMKEVRKLKMCKDIPIIAISAYAMQSERKMLLQAGFTDYISKPFSRKALKGIVSKNLRSS